jgi:hypothetical protein
MRTAAVDGVTTRSEVEQAIIDEESMLERVAGLLEVQSDIAE